jgi:hypothetical protein
MWRWLINLLTWQSQEQKNLKWLAKQRKLERELLQNEKRR